jgi:hypothetical protein
VIARDVAERNRNPCRGQLGCLLWVRLLAAGDWETGGGPSSRSTGPGTTGAGRMPMGGYIRCEDCGWARVYARFSVVRILNCCPACGGRVARERHPTADSPALRTWQLIAKRLIAQSASARPAARLSRRSRR